MVSAWSAQLYNFIRLCNDFRWSFDFENFQRLCRRGLKIIVMVLNEMSFMGRYCNHSFISFVSFWVHRFRAWLGDIWNWLFFQQTIFFRWNRCCIVHGFGNASVFSSLSLFLSMISIVFVMPFCLQNQRC